MSARYVLATAARQDRKDIFTYTYERSGSIEIARGVDRKLKEELERIAQTPTIGHTRADLGIPKHLLVRVVFSYLLIYNPAARPVRILRILAWGAGEAGDFGTLAGITSMSAATSRASRIAQPFTSRGPKIWCQYWCQLSIENRPNLPKRAENGVEVSWRHTTEIALGADLSYLPLSGSQ